MEAGVGGLGNDTQLDRSKIEFDFIKLLAPTKTRSIHDRMESVQTH